MTETASYYRLPVPIGPYRVQFDTQTLIYPDSTYAHIPPRTLEVLIAIVLHETPSREKLTDFMYFSSISACLKQGVYEDALPELETLAESNLHVHVSRLRNTFDIPITTLRGHGYRFEPDTTLREFADRLNACWQKRNEVLFEEYRYGMLNRAQLPF
jgi:hypothetical protein